MATTKKVQLQNIHNDDVIYYPVTHINYVEGFQGFQSWMKDNYLDVAGVQGAIEEKILSFNGEINLDSYVNKNEVSIDGIQTDRKTLTIGGKQGTFLTEHQSLDGYATEEWVGQQGYLKSEDLKDYAKTEDLEEYVKSDDLDTNLEDYLKKEEAVIADKGTGEKEVTLGGYQATFLTKDALGEYSTTTGVQGLLDALEKKIMTGGTNEEIDKAFDTIKEIADYLSGHQGTVTEIISGIQGNQSKLEELEESLGELETSLGDYVKSESLNDYYTKEEVDDVIEGVQGQIGEYVKKSDVGFDDETGDDTTMKVILDGDEKEVLIAHQSLDAYATTEWVGQQGFISKNDTEYETITGDIQSIKDLIAGIQTRINGIQTVTDKVNVYAVETTDNTNS